MPSPTIVATLVVYNVLLLAIGVLAERRTRDEADFVLGGKKLGPWVTAISASASSSSAWTLLGVSGFAYAHGRSAVWLFPACVGGFALNWYVVAPRLRALAAATGALTVTEVLAGPLGRPRRGAIVGLASAIVLVSLLVYVASQFQGAGKAFAATLGIDQTTSVLLGAGIVIGYMLLGGFWAVSLTDTLQGLLMAATAVVLPALALVAVGGPGAMLEALERVDDPAYAGWTDGLGGIGSVGLVLGFFGIGLGYPGQPHVVNRFMAARDARALRQGRRIAMTWAVLVYGGMLVLGWCGRILVRDLGDSEQVFLAAANALCSPVVAGIMLASVLSAIMSTADSQLLVAASTISHDLGAARGERGLQRSRAVVLLLAVAACAAALGGGDEIFRPVLFAWTAMGASFGPLLLLTLWRGRVGSAATLGSMASGFVVSVVAYQVQIAQPGKRVLDYVLPFVVAFVVAIALDRKGAGER